MQILNEDGNLVILAETPIRFTYQGVPYTVPADFRSDGASVPRFFWRLLSPPVDPKTLVPSIVHDYLYKNKIGTRKGADLWYRDALIENGYPRWKAELTYWGLRVGGASHWGGDEP